MDININVVDAALLAEVTSAPEICVVAERGIEIGFWTEEKLYQVGTSGVFVMAIVQHSTADAETSTEIIVGRDESELAHSLLGRGFDALEVELFKRAGIEISKPERADKHERT